MNQSNYISANIPEHGKDIANYAGRDIVDRLGPDVVKSAVTSILSGGNVRSLTEGLTRVRLNLSNGAMLFTYLNCLKNITDFSPKLTDLVEYELINLRNDTETKMYLNWLIGLTGKSIQNVLRSDLDELKAYLDALNESLSKSVKESNKIYGNIAINIIDQDNQKYFLQWPQLLQLFTAVGAQTLTIRGSEKSIYGKFFERLVLGSVLSILGFHKLETGEVKANNVFWLSERGDKRESDATLLYEPGKGVRFDIGFIGPGNTEISLDKVSRFEREIEFGRNKYYTTTIVLVDRVGDRSRISELAQTIDGYIIQMSMTYWVKELADILNKEMGFYHRINDLTNQESLEFVKTEMENVDLNLFVK